MIRLGLCCTFRDQPIKFAHTTAMAIGKMGRADGLAKLRRLGLTNAEALLAALRFCAGYGIGCFRISSQVLPLRTHPEHEYGIDDLSDGGEIIGRFQDCGSFAGRAGVRTGFHPDQFVVLNSPRRLLSKHPPQGYLASGPSRSANLKDQPREHRWLSEYRR